MNEDSIGSTGQLVNDDDMLIGLFTEYCRKVDVRSATCSGFWVPGYVPLVR